MMSIMTMLLQVFLLAAISIFGAGLIEAAIPHTFSTVLGGLSAVLAGSGIAIEVYSRLPQQLIYGSQPKKLPIFDSTDVVLIFPGAGGPDENTDNLAKAIKESDKKCGIKRFIHVYDWREWRGNLFRASYDGQSVGETIGSQLASISTTTGGTELASLHVIGVSVGAFAADSCARVFKEITRRKRTCSSSGTLAQPPYVRVTLLDPFCSRGVFGQKYGANYFGKDADYCEHYLNTDDPVPFTNEPLPNACTFDVTGAADRRNFVPLPGDNMHSWPVAYLGKIWKTKKSNDGSLYKPVHEFIHRRGAIIKIP